MVFLFGGVGRRPNFGGVVGDRTGRGVVDGVRVVWRASSMASAMPKWTDAGLCQPMPEWR
jgi:hypothetical protein